MDRIFIYSIVMMFFAMGVFLLIEKPKKFILIFISVSPIVNLFWGIKVLEITVVELFSGMFPLVFMIIYLNNKKRSKWYHGKYNKHFLVILLSFLIASLSKFISGASLLSSIDNFVKIFCGYSSYQIFLNLFSLKEQNRLQKSVLYAVLIVLSMVSYQLLSGHGLYQTDSGIYSDKSLSGGYHDPGQYTRLALIGILILLPNLKSLNLKLPKIIKYAIIGLCIVTLGFSISRNVVITVFIVLVAYGLISRKIVTSSIILIFGIIFYLSSPIVQGLYEKKLHTEIEYFSGANVRLETLGSGRIGIWERTIEKFTAASPIEKIFGTGFDIGPHGQYLGLLLYGGILGFSITYSFYLMLLIKTIFKLKRNRDNKIASLSFLMLLAVLTMSVGSAPITDYYFQIILFAFIALFELQGNSDKLHNYRNPEIVSR